MSFYTTFKEWNKMIEYLNSVDYPKCFTVNYLPEENEYALWIGNQPYYTYEQEIEKLETALKEVNTQKERISKKNNDLLHEIIEIENKLEDKKNECDILKNRLHNFLISTNSK